MFPLSEDTLSFWEIADFWSREIPASQGELLDRLEAAWWRGEITGISALTRLQFLQRVFEARQRSSFGEIVFVTPNDGGPWAETPQADGGVIVDMRPRISVPGERENWTEDSCSAAFETLGKSPSREHFPFLQVSLHYIGLSREEFFEWVEMYGFDVPRFWRRRLDKSSGAEAVRGKVPRVIDHLREIFPVAKFPKGVPSPAHCPRKGLRKDLLDKYQDLEGSLDDGTLKKAIERYNKSL